MEDSDRNYLQNWVLERDPNAFEALTRKYSGLVYATCLRVTRDRTEAEDAAQECFATLSMVDNMPKTPLGAWLHRVATNGSLDRIRARKRRTAYETNYAREQADCTEIQWKDVERLVDEAIEELPEKLRLPAVAHYWEGQSYTDIAKAIGTSRQTVTYRVETAVKRIRKSLKKQGVSVAPSLIAAMLTTHLTQAATVPAVVSASLAKIAVAGVVNAASSAGSGVTAATLLGGIVMAKSKIIGAGFVVALLIGFVVWSSRDDLSGTENETPPSQRASALEAEADASNPELTAGPISVQSENTQVAPTQVEEEEAETEEEKGPESKSRDDLGISSVHGHVIDEFGALAAAAKVRIAVLKDKAYGNYRQFLPADNQYETVTDDEGAFFIEGIRAEGWGIAVATIHGAHGTQTVDLRKANDADGIVITLISGASLKGIVLSHEGVPVKGAGVSTLLWVGETRSDDEMEEVTLSDANGYFELIYPESGEATIRVTSVKGDGVFLVTTGTSEIHELELKKPAGVFGTITHYDGVPAQEMLVQLEAEHTMDSPFESGLLSSHRNRYAAETDENGDYMVSEVAPGYEYTIRVRSIFGANRLRTEKMPLGAVGPGESRNWDYVLDEKLAITGRVLGRTSGLPISYATVILLGEEIVNTTSDEDGRFELNVGPPGEYSITPSFRSLGNLTTPGAEVQTIQLNYDHSTEVELYLDESYARTFRFVDDFGRPVPDVTALTQWQGPGDVRSGKDGFIRLGPTGEDGLAHYDGFAPVGEYILWSRIHGVGPQKSRPFNGQSGVDYPVEDIVVYRLAGLEGVAKDASGGPMRNQELEVHAFRDNEQLTQFSIRTDDHGYFFTENQVPATTVTLTLSNSTADRWQSERIEFPADLITDLGVVRLRGLPSLNDERRVESK